MNTFASISLDGFSPHKFVFLRKSHDLTSIALPQLEQIETGYKDYVILLQKKQNLLQVYFWIIELY